MTSINTNIAAQQALRTLQSTNGQLDATQNRISTGLKIAEAKDNAAYWSISTTLKSDNKALGTVKDALALGSATVDTAYRGLNETLSVLNEITTKLTAATNGAVDKAAVQREISALQEQLKSIAGSSTFGGENWLSATGADAKKSIVSGFNRDSAGVVTLSNIEVDTAGLRLISAGEGLLEGDSGVLSIDIEDLTREQIVAAIDTVTKAANAVTASATTLGAVAKRIELQQSFVSNLMDTIDKGVSGLIDADMNEESTRLQALQVKQQLGVQALSIANQSAQNVLRLFQ